MPARLEAWACPVAGQGCVANPAEQSLAVIDDLLTAEELRGNDEDRVNELSLSDRIALRDPADLAFSDRVHRLIALDGSARTLGRTEAEARGYPLLDESMVLL